MAEKEYIERAALYEKCKQFGLGYGSVLGRHSGVADEILDFIQNEPAADVVEVVQGTWRFEHDPITDPKGYFIRIVCSCCGLKTGQVSNYCPNCGAKMEEAAHV